MIIKVHASGGHSFKGLVDYLINDEGRVAWTETRNLFTENPVAASRVMAATANNGASLKRAAGISNAGRKGGGAVMHVTLSWKDEESKLRRLSPDQMSAAVETMLQNLGATGKQRSQYADEHQAIIISHNDKKHDHVHVVINRVHPEHGVYLPTSNDYLKLSAWALRYETEGGRIYSPNRALNWERRKDQYVRGKTVTRKIWNVKRNSIEADHAELKEVIKRERKQDAPFYAERRQLRNQHAHEWNMLTNDYKSTFAQLKTTLAKKHHVAKEEITTSFSQHWEDRFNTKERAFRDFLKGESSLHGRFCNALKTLEPSNFSSARKSLQALDKAIAPFLSQNVRLRSFANQQKRLDLDLEQDNSAALKNCDDGHRTKQQATLKARRDQFLENRERLVKKHADEMASLRKRWRIRNRERKHAFTEIGHRLKGRLHAKLNRIQAVAERLAGKAPKTHQKIRQPRMPEDKERLRNLEERTKLINRMHSSGPTKRNSSDFNMR